MVGRVCVCVCAYMLYVLSLCCAGLEHSDLVQLVPPLMGRLTVFDPRFPHGVRQVRGSRDPRKGRLVLHGG